MNHQELNTCAENVINDIFGYADLHHSGFDQEEATLNLLQEVAQRCDEHIKDLLKRTQKGRHVEMKADNTYDTQRENNRQAA